MPQKDEESARQDTDNSKSDSTSGQGFTLPGYKLGPTRATLPSDPAFQLPFTVLP